MASYSNNEALPKTFVMGIDPWPIPKSENEAEYQKIDFVRTVERQKHKINMVNCLRFSTRMHACAYGPSQFHQSARVEYFPSTINEGGKEM